jgi:glycosyltransferase involved in cell wall biosynthesis
VTVRLLFVKTSLAWPRATGHDVYTYHTMKACAELGHDISLATASEPRPEALEAIQLMARFRLDLMAPTANTLPATWLQKRFRSFWGVPDSHIAALQRVVSASRADAAIIIGLDALPYFPSLSNVVRVWYAADEWIWHHLSQVRAGDPNAWPNLRSAAIKGLYERAHARSVDRVWVVSNHERRAMRWLAGMRHVDVLPLGVDGDRFQPQEQPVEPRTAVFWGRLDFGPNVQALEWFFARVWPLVRQSAPDARFTIVGFHPGKEIAKLTSLGGVTVLSDLPDLRDAVRSHGVVVLPFVSGGGVKNKLLEAAALGLPIVCTPRATQGLCAVNDAPFAIVSKPHEMCEAILNVWSNDQRRLDMGSGARKWVLKHHSWITTAETAIATLNDATTASIQQRRSRASQ